jgi:ribonuclease Z
MLSTEDDRYNEVDMNLGSYQYRGSSIGGERTYHGIQNLKVCFDLGLAPLSTTNLNIITFSHGHADHCGGLIPHLWRRHVRRLPMANYYAQADDALLLQEIVNTSCKLSRNDLIEDVIKPITGPIKLNDQLELSWFNSVHRVPCVGSLISKTKRNLSQKEIIDLRNSGTDVMIEVKSPEIAYTGDTSIDVFDLNPVILETRYLITECTALDGEMDRDKVRKVGHIHLDDLVELFKERAFLGEKLILGHFSARYSYEYCLKLVREKLPEMSDKIIVI